MLNIEIIKGDITKLKVDCIVNAANTSLLGGGGIDGAVHLAAGPKLLEECIKLNGCQTGEAKITSGYDLPSKFIIHTPGPIWEGGDWNEDELLANCYKNSLDLTKTREILTIAFPSIATGIYGFPLDRASKIALKIIKEFLDKNDKLKVFIVCFDDLTYAIYKKNEAEFLI